jgi:hypothetical protein
MSERTHIRLIWACIAIMSLCAVIEWSARVRWYAISAACWLSRAWAVPMVRLGVLIALALLGCAYIAWHLRRMDAIDREIKRLEHEDVE